MAESSVQDVVNHSQSAGDASPSDAPVTTSQSIFAQGAEGEVVEVKENGVQIEVPMSAQDEQMLEDGTARSDTDTSRADGDAKSVDNRPVKKLAAMKPVSFAKYSVPSLIKSNASKAQPTTGRQGWIGMRV